LQGIEILIRTPLSRAAEKGDERVVKLLLENGARPDFEEVYGYTPLSRAVDEKIVKLLKSHRTIPEYSCVGFYDRNG